VEFLSLTQSNWFIVGPVAHVLGFIMNGIYEFLELVGLPNIGIAIIVFTFLTKALMLPMSIKQQKFSKLNTVMAPELQEIQSKYRNLDKNSPKYNEMLLKQQSEMKEVYEKYGTSPMSGCGQLLIQMPILFALYQVIYKIPGYVGKIKDIYTPLMEKLINIPGYAETATETTSFLNLAQSNGISVDKMAENTNHIIDLFYNFDPSEWNNFAELFPALQADVEAILPVVTDINYFLGIDLATAPSAQLWPGILIPILAGLTQWLSSKMITPASANSSKEDTMGSTMKTMNIMMPLMSVFFCFTFAAGIGVYWVASSVVQIITQFVVNKYMERIDVNKMVEKNIEKANAKRIKNGQKPIKAKPVLSVKTIEESKELERQKTAQTKERAAAQAEKSTSYYTSTNTKKGKLASKAGMVQQYNEKNMKK